MEEEWKKNCLFELKHAEMLPFLKIEEIETKALGDDLFRLTVVVVNEGFLPTNVTQKAIDNRLVRPVKATLKLEGAELLIGKPGVELGHIPGREISSSRFGSRSVSSSPNKKTVQWLLRGKKKKVVGEVVIESQKAGTTRKEIIVRSP